MEIELVKTYPFEAAHVTPWRDAPARLHGHSYEVDLVLSGECDADLGWLIDYAEITERFEPFYRRLDHQTLNDVEGLVSPTLEGIRVWLLEGLRPAIPGLLDARVRIVGDRIFAPKLLHEDAAAGLPERVRFGFEAAHALPNLPPEHKCHTMHGHSFVAEVGAANIDTTLAPRLQELHEQLDHRCLNDVAGLENPTSELLSRWIWNALSGDVAGLSTVVVAETCTARCVYRGK